MQKRKIKSLYIHIPFCRRICPYCDFLKLFKNKQFESRYVNRLLKDLSFLGDKSFNFETVYIGGGTPSCLDTNHLELILEKVNEIINKDHEFTIEANPEDINEDFLKLCSKYGVNRISIGIQTFDKKILDSINRNYNINYFNLINLVKKYIQNINLDFIYGLPNYSLNTLKKDLKTFFELNVNHASFYSLIVEKGTIYFNKGIKEVNDSKSRKYYDFILSEMRKNGFERYEISNFAKPGYESKHNLTYWHNEEYCALGLGSSGYEGNIRYTNTKNFTEYINGKNNRSEEIIDKKLLEEYYLITNLRLKEGFSLDEYHNIFKIRFESKYKNNIEKLKKDKLIDIKDNRFFCTDEGLILLDLVLLNLI